MALHAGKPTCPQVLHSQQRILAERGGFEPPVDFKGLRRFSKPLLSTTQPPLREPASCLVRFISDRSTFPPIYRVDGMASGAARMFHID